MDILLYVVVINDNGLSNLLEIAEKHGGFQTQVAEVRPESLVFFKKNGFQICQYREENGFITAIVYRSATELPENQIRVSLGKIPNVKLVYKEDNGPCQTRVQIDGQVYRLTFME